MFDKLHQMVADAAARIDRTAHRTLDRLTKFAGALVAMLVFGLLAGAALLALCAAAVVALVPSIGTAGALACVGGGLFVTSLIVLFMISRSLHQERSTQQSDGLRPGSSGAPSGIANQTADTSAPDRLTEVKPNPSHASSTGPAFPFEIGKIDPLLVVAAGSAAVALLGTSRIARLVARATAAAAFTRSILPLVPSAVAGIGSILKTIQQPANPAGNTHQPEPTRAA